jgi:hypothetical protein
LRHSTDQKIAHKNNSGRSFSAFRTEEITMTMDFFS